MTTMSIRDKLAQAISLGAPLYNAGRPADCLKTYVAAALDIVEAGNATPGERKVLKEAVERASLAGSTDEGAWAMRRAFDSILSGAVAARERAAELVASVGPSGEFEVLSYERGLVPGPRWLVMDDVIMGGRSQSEGLQYDAAEGAAVYSGMVTTDGGGGFASVRSDEWPGFESLAAARGVRMLVKGDGRQYKLSMKTDADWDGVQYQHDFTAPPAWQVVELPFSAFKPTFRGRVVAGRPPLQGQPVRQLGLMVSKFTADGGVISSFRNGSFRLGLRWVRGFV